MKFVMKGLKTIHEKSGLSVYRVCQDTKVAWNTVTRYLKDDEVVLGQIETSLIKIIEYYGANWHDLIEVMPEAGDIEPEGEIISPPHYLTAVSTLQP